MREAVIVDAIRTPVGRRKGALANERPEEFGAKTVNALLTKTGIDPNLIEDLKFGCNTQVNEQGANPARRIALASNLPYTVSGVTINRWCCSSQEAVHNAAQAIIAGDADFIIAGGVESMTRMPMGSEWPSTWAPMMANKHEITLPGIAAEMIADKWGLSRKELDEFGLLSHQRAIKALDEGKLKDECFPIEVTKEDGTKFMFTADEGPRRDTTLEKLSSLKPPFKEGGKITAGNSSQVSDAAAALLIASKETALAHGMKPRAKVKTRVVVGSDPTFSLTGPIPATELALKRSGLKISDIDFFEVNEAFASVVLAWQREFKVDMAKINPNGGAIAIGHPLGASGARIMITMLHELERRGGTFALQTMCIGHGHSCATIIERM
ncbi:MAG TPA: thiolase family protein [Syntrophales bacterium]|nr:thiolase family protein [Syntrophales bacterium]